MRLNIYFIIIVALCSLATVNAQNVGINTSNPDSSAVLDISGDGGVLFPRMNTAQRDAIPSPRKGLMIFN